MKKIKLLAFFCGLQLFIANAQTALPANCDFNAFAASGLPANWTTNIPATNVYATGGVASTPAIKFGTGAQYVEVYTAGAMGTVSYYLRGYAGSGINNWLGGFSVEESINGSTWSAVATYTDTQITIGSVVSFSVSPNSNSRYLRWYFLNKISGFNIALDDVYITAAPTTAQEINIKQGGNTILSGSNSALFNSAVGTTTVVNFVIENLGTVSPLTINSFSLSGTAASEFTVTAPAAPSTITASSNATLALAFNPTVAGTRSAVLTINNDDADEGMYVINLNGVGGNYASEPSAQASGLTISNIKSYRAAASFSPAAGSPEGYIIFKKQGSSAITDLPSDGVAYQIGDAVGSCKVIYVGTGTAIGLSNIYAGLPYQLAIFTFNGSGVYTNYNTTLPPLLGSFNAATSMQPINKYNTIPSHIYIL